MRIPWLVAILFLPSMSIAQAAPDAAWATYDEAFARVVAGRDEEAVRILETLRTTHPESPAALLGAELERLIQSRRTGTVTPPDAALRERLATSIPTEPPALAPRRLSLVEYVRDEEPTSLARAELISLQTLNGLSIGLELCGIAECDSRPTVLSAFLGAGLGAFVSSLISRPGITHGHTLAINSGSGWGIAAGLAIHTIADIQDEKALLGLIAGMDALGTVAGHFAWERIPSGAGDVSLGNTGGIWMGFVTGLSLVAVNPSNLSSQSAAAIITTGSLAGLIGGAVLSRHYPMTRSRTLLIDVGAISGGLFGAGIGVLVRAESQAMAAMAASGIVAGVGLASYLTRNWDLDALPLAFGLAPTNGGLLLTVNALR